MSYQFTLFDKHPDHTLLNTNVVEFEILEHDTVSPDSSRWV